MNTVLLCCFLVLLELTATLTAPIGQNQPKRRRWKRPQTAGEVNDYLFTYGYMKNRTNATSDEFKRSIKRYQRFNRLKVTGEMNNETLTLMATPRCGLPDKSETSGRRKRYVLYGTKWPNPNLTYKIVNYTPDLPTDTTKSSIQQALKDWSDVAKVSFTESKTASGNLRFGFYTGAHGDSDPFDGPGGTLAHGFFPQGGMVHYDEDESWSDSSNGVNLRQVSTHEVGHAMGLDHSTNPIAVMYAYYRYKKDFKLDNDDIQGIQALYGPASSTSTTTSSTSSSTSTSRTSSYSSTSTSRTSSSSSTSTSRTSSSSSTSTSKTSPSASASTPKTPSFRATPTILTSSTTTTRTTSRPTTTKTTTTQRSRGRPCKGFSSWFGYC